MIFYFNLHAAISRVSIGHELLCHERHHRNYNWFWYLVNIYPLVVSKNSRETNTFIENTGYSLPIL